MAQSQSPTQNPNRVRIVVATSVMLTFISFWRAAAIVLNDLGSSAFYAAGIAEQAVGKAAPWFIVGVMVFSFAVRAVYVESCSMFVRGGVYRVVKEALGGTLAKISVSALMFDYILTGPISGVSAGHYIGGLLNKWLATADSAGWVPAAIHRLGYVQHHGVQISENGVAVALALAMTLFYWWENIKGISESSEKALRVMQITTVMVVMLLAWSALTLMIGTPPNGQAHWHLPPWPTPSTLNFSPEALGFLKNLGWAKTLGLFGILIAFGHSVLAMSGEESLAQVNRELAHPKLKNLKRAAVIIAIYSFVFTGGVSVLGGILIPDEVRVKVYSDNLISGLAMYQVGPNLLKLLFQTFVVFVGFLMLSGAINTAIVGSNGVLNRVSEDGVLTEWFRKPHKRFGTSYRILNLVVGLQVVTIIASGGNVYTLGEAYAFGVIWSFTFNSLAMLVLRWKFKGQRGWKVPPNITVAGREIPLGLFSVFLVLLMTALVNLFTKSVATVAGLSFTIIFFVLFYFSERVNRRKFSATERQMREQFQLLHRDTVDNDSVGIRPGNILVAVRDYNTLNHLKWVLTHTSDDIDIVVLAARLTGPGSAEYDLSMDQIFSDYEQTLFTRAVAVAEGFGRHVDLLVVPARDVWSAIVQTANALESSAIVAGLSSKMTAQEQAFYLGRAWEAMPEPKKQTLFQVVRPDMEVDTYRIGPHTPSMRTEDVHLVHRLWLDITREKGLEKVHHSDLVSMALTRFAREFTGDGRQEIIRDLKKIEQRRGAAAALPEKASGTEDEGPPVLRP
jgi:amino acid transporter